MFYNRQMHFCFMLTFCLHLNFKLIYILVEVFLNFCLRESAFGKLLFKVFFPKNQVTGLVHERNINDVNDFTGHRWSLDKQNDVNDKVGGKKQRSTGK